jgi:hypothetical protein
MLRVPATRRGGPVLTVVLVVVAVLLVVLVATGGNVPLATEGSGGWHLDGRRDAPPARTSTRPSGLGDLPEDSRLPGEGILAVLAQTAVIAVGLTVLVLTGRALQRLSRRPREPLDLDPPEHWPEPGREMAEAIDDGLVALSAGPVDEVIVACWVGLEEAAAAAGIAREASETSAELASRVLTSLDAPAAAVDELLQRYRRARFSRHPLAEADRAAAIRSLEEIRVAISGAHA